MRLRYFLHHPIDLFFRIGRNTFLRLLPDKQFLQIRYKYLIGKKLNIEYPTSFNEKMQYLKIHNRNPIYSTMVDKCAAKDYVAKIVGDKYVIPTYAVWEKIDDIDINGLPDQFVIKCTHDSGGLYICRNKEKFDFEQCKKNIAKSMKRNYFWVGREWPYKNVKPRIIVEKYMQDGSCRSLTVYKVFNFNGEPKLIQVILNDKSNDETVDYYDVEWNKLDLKQNYDNSTIVLNRPEKLQEMLTLARKLSVRQSFLRTDFYIVNGEVFFSEFTFFSDSGFASFAPEYWDKNLGELIDLSLCSRSETAK